MYAFLYTFILGFSTDYQSHTEIWMRAVKRGISQILVLFCLQSNQCPIISILWRKEECSLESYFKLRLIVFRLLVRREKFQAHSFHLYNSMASINLKFLLENSCIQKTSKPSQHTGISSHGDHWQPWHLKEPFHFHNPKFYSSENGWNLLGYFEYNINVLFYKNFFWRYTMW